MVKTDENIKFMRAIFDLQQQEYLMNFTFKRKTGYSLSRFIVLSEIYHHGESGISISELVQELNVLTATISKQITYLNARGLVQRIGNQDRRKSQVILTVSGQQVYLQMVSQLEAVIEREKRASTVPIKYTEHQVNFLAAFLMEFTGQLKHNELV